MSILPILIAPDPILKRIAEPVISVDDEIRILMKNMLETMYDDKGVGLAAPQVGISKRVITIDLQDDDDDKKQDNFYPLFIANPEILEKSEELVLADEGCLSLPEQRVEVVRARSIKLKFLDYNNKAKILELHDWLARVVQHEIDHLNGILLIDHLSVTKRDVALRKLKKIKKHLL